MKFSLREVKTKGDKEAATPFEFFILEPLSLPMVWFLANFTRISPNAVTIFTALVIFLGSLCVFKGWFLLGWLIIFFGFVLDWVDGRLARLKKLASPLGAFLDHIADTFRFIIAIPSLMYYAYSFNPDVTIVIWGLVYIALVQMLQAFYGRSKQLNKGKLITKVMEEKKKKGLFMRIRGFFKKRRLLLSYSPVDTDGIVLVILPLLALIFNDPNLIKMGFIIASIMLGVLYVALVALQTKITLSQE